MAGRIRDEDVKRVREACPIADIVGEHLQLRNAGGGNLKGLCPFHDEKTPSFQVTPSRGLYFCFGCGIGGDVIDFVMRVDHLGFTEAVEQLASRVGIELRYAEGGFTTRGERSQRSRLLEAHKEAAAFYVAQLATPAAGRGRALLAERGFDEAAIADFGIGYAPGGWDVLVRHLRARGFTDQELLLGGLASQGRRGPIDRFRDRLVWPIADLSGEVIAFGARRLDDDPNSPKYLNSPETPLFKKSAVLYGLDRARRRITQGQRVVIVEGYTDVMACHLAGVDDAVATCGTSFGDEHINVLRRLLSDRNQYLRGSIIFTFDGDAAGRKAALRAFDDDQKFLAHTAVAVEPNGLDPCELRMKHGDAAVRELVASHVALLAFALDATLEPFDVETPEGRAGALHAVVPLIAKVKDPALLDQYVRYVRRQIGEIDEAYLRAQVREARRGRPAGSRQGQGQGHGSVPAPSAPARGRGTATRPDPHDPVGRTEREALKIALRSPVLAGPMFDELDVDEFTTPSYAAIRQAIADAGGAAAAVAGEDWIAAVRARLADDGLRGLVTELVVERLLFNHDESDPGYVNRCLTEIRVRSVARHAARLKARLERLNPVKQPEEYNRLFGELAALERYRHGLIDQLSA